MFRGAVYRDVSIDDPDLPESLRMNSSNSNGDTANTLQRSMSMVSLGQAAIENPSDSNQPPTQVMSVSDEDLDWAEQMRQESEDRNQNESQGLILKSLDGFYFRWL